MALKVETSYINKQGKEVELKNPVMKVMGKLMDREEVHEFVILADSIRVWEGGLFPKYNLYVTYDHVNATPFNLELSPQAYKEVDMLDFKKGDRLQIKKDYIANKKTGAENPIIRADITNREVSRSHFKPNNTGSNSAPTQPLTPNNANIEFSVSLENYFDVFKKSLEANPRKVGLNDFVASYFRIPANKLPIVDKLVEMFEGNFPATPEPVKEDKTKGKKNDGTTGTDKQGTTE